MPSVAELDLHRSQHRQALGLQLSWGVDIGWAATRWRAPTFLIQAPPPLQVSTGDLNVRARVE